MKPALVARAKELALGSALGGVGGALLGTQAPHLDAQLEWEGQDGKTYRRGRTRDERGRLVRNALLGGAGGAVAGGGSALAVSKLRRLLLDRLDDRATEEAAKALKGTFDDTPLFRAPFMSRARDARAGRAAEDLAGYSAAAREARRESMFGGRGLRYLTSNMDLVDDRALSTVGRVKRDHGADWLRQATTFAGLAKGASVAFLKEAAAINKTAEHAIPDDVSGGATEMHKLLEHLLALYLLYYEAHWKSSGTGQYGDHTLYTRLYGGVLGELDTLAEKLLGLHGFRALDMLRMVRGACCLLAEWECCETLLNRALLAENSLQDALAAAYKSIERQGGLTLGLDDFLMATANAHETNLYLLQQRARPAQGVPRIPEGV